MKIYILPSQSVNGFRVTISGAKSVYSGTVVSDTSPKSITGTVLKNTKSELTYRALAVFGYFNTERRFEL